MIDPSSRAPDSSLSRRICRMVALDPGATALFFGGLTFPWSFYSDAVADLETLLAAHPAARRVGIVLRNRPGPLVALVATLGTGREVVTLSPHLGDIGLEQDIVDLAPDVVVAEDEDWARDAVLVSAGAAETGRADLRADDGGVPRHRAGLRRGAQAAPAQPDGHPVGVPGPHQRPLLRGRARGRGPQHRAPRAVRRCRMDGAGGPAPPRLRPARADRAADGAAGRGPGGDVRQRPRGRVGYRAAAAGTGGGIRSALRNTGPRDLRRDRIRRRDRGLDTEGQEAVGAA